MLNGDIPFICIGYKLETLSKMTITLNHFEQSCGHIDYVIAVYNVLALSVLVYMTEAGVMHETGYAYSIHSSTVSGWLCGKRVRLSHGRS